MIFIKYRHFNSLWTRISLFFDDHWFLGWIVTMVSVIGGSIIFGLFIASLYIDKTTNIAENNKTLYKHIIVIERTYGVTDSLIYHDINTDVEAKLADRANKLFITTKGANWLGISVGNDVIIESVKSFKIIK